MRFVYLGPPCEPEVEGTFHGLTGEWLVGVPREIADPAQAAVLGRHPHWAVAPEVDEVEEPVEPEGGVPLPAEDDPAPRRRRRGD